MTKTNTASAGVNGVRSTRFSRLTAHVAPWIAIAGLGAACARTIEIPFPRSEGKARWHLTAILYRPEGPGPYPLAVINHGSAITVDDRRRPTYAFVEQSRWFVDQGFVVVVPSRRGYGSSDGTYAEGYGRCEDANYRLAGLETARDIWVVIDFMSQQPFVDGSRVVVVGHSAGGFGSLALASLNPPGVVGVINFAGGRGSIGSDRVCAPERERAAFFEFGRSSKIPSLWLYATNDGYFGPSLARAWYEEYIRAGGQAQFVELPATGACHQVFADTESVELYPGGDGHQLFAEPGSLSLWTPAVGRFLTELGFAAPKSSSKQ